MRDSNSALATAIVEKTREEMLQLLQGGGIEIGALQNPASVPHLKVQYVDRLTREEAYEHYPELKGAPLVKVDIVDDGEELTTIPTASQDFVIANHVIEHMANPIKALLNWGRVLVPGGRLFLAVPDKHCTFDKEREKTTIEHLRADYDSPSAERDYEHFKDFALKVSCRVFEVKPESESEIFAKHLWDMKYSIHYHVWDYESFLPFISYVQREFPTWNMKVVDTVPTKVNEFLLVLEKGR